MATISIYEREKFSFQMQFRGVDNIKRRDKWQSNREELDYINNNMNQYIDFSVPWVFWSFSYNQFIVACFKGNHHAKPLNFNGELKLTDKWKLTLIPGRLSSKKDVTVHQCKLTETYKIAGN